MLFRRINSPGGVATRAQILLARLRASTFAKDSAVLSLGTIAAQGITVAAIPLLSRLYLPADFGLLSVFTAVSSVVATGITLRYETSILLPKDNAESSAVVCLSLTLSLLLGVVCGVTAWLIPTNFLSLIGLVELGHWLPAAVLAGLAIAVLNTGLGLLNRLRVYAEMSQLRVAQSVITAMAGLALGYNDKSAGLLLAQIIGLSLPCFLIVKRLMPLMRQWHGRTLVYVARKHKAAPRYLLPIALLDVVAISLPLILIARWFGSGVAGQFSMAWRILCLPLALFGGAIGQVFFQRFSQAWPDIIASKRLLFMSWLTLALIGFAPMLLVVFFGEEIFCLVLGPHWGQSGKMASVLAPMLFFSLLHSPTSTASIVLGLQRQVLVLSMAVILYRPLSIYIGWRLDNVYIGLAIYSALESIQFFVFQYMVYRRIKLEVKF